MEFGCLFLVYRLDKLPQLAGKVRVLFPRLDWPNSRMGMTSAGARPIRAGAAWHAVWRPGKVKPLPGRRDGRSRTDARKEHGHKIKARRKAYASGNPPRDPGRSASPRFRGPLLSPDAIEPLRVGGIRIYQDG